MIDKPSLRQYNPYSFFYVSAIENNYMPTDSSCNTLNGKTMEKLINTANEYAINADWWKTYTNEQNLPLIITTTNDLNVWITQGINTSVNDVNAQNIKTQYDQLILENDSFNYGDCFELGENDDIMANEDIIKRCLDASLCRNRDRSGDYSTKMNRDGSSKQRYDDVKREFNEEFMNSINLILGSLILGGLIFKQYYSK